LNGAACIRAAEILEIIARDDAAGEAADAGEIPGAGDVAGLGRCSGRHDRDEGNEDKPSEQFS
jgi:hypothetical protein